MPSILNIAFQVRRPAQPFSWYETEAAFAASSDELKRLDLYANLSWLPKNTDLARDPMRDDILADAESGTPEELSVRQQGRLKHKKALITKLQRGDSGPSASMTPATLSEEPEPKKAKQDRPTDEDEMDEE